MKNQDYIQKATIVGLEMFAVPHPTVVECDYPGCKRQFPQGIGIRSNDDLLREKAISAGWTGPMQRGQAGDDRCPEHSLTTTT